jgi:hypothetical protein
MGIATLNGLMDDNLTIRTVAAHPDAREVGPVSGVNADRNAVR